MTKKSVTKFLKKNYEGWLFNLPLAIGLLLFTAIPVGTSLYYSFFETDGFTYTFVGLDNYIKIFTRDRSIWQVVKNTLAFAMISIPLNLSLSYLLAQLVNQTRKGVKTFRLLYYLPVIIPLVVGGLLWKDLYDPTYGIFNRILELIGLDPFPFFFQASTSMFSIILMNVWGIGGGMILWLAAFKNIPKTMYESANLDGANAFQRFWHITIPLSTPMIFFNVVTSIIGTLQYNGTLTFAPREGRGVDDSLYMYAVKIYWEAFHRGQIGYGSALAWLLLIVCAIITILLFKKSKWVFYGEDI
ncbi:MAG TPA: sugar ABC transporter permease [Candidatus Izemoplasmatales bacterium]|nr:sugar ABC transporter permease [Bacillota bacterium]HRY77550.1 sugar ABC transporter permease [Candidatus Izemoplasmatales bacterium]